MLIKQKKNLIAYFTTKATGLSSNQIGSPIRFRLLDRIIVTILSKKLKCLDLNDIIYTIYPHVLIPNF